jgi:hypothetical protein
MVNGPITPYCSPTPTPTPTPKDTKKEPPQAAHPQPPGVQAKNYMQGLRKFAESVVNLFRGSEEKRRIQKDNKIIDAMNKKEQHIEHLTNNIKEINSLIISEKIALGKYTQAINSLNRKFIDPDMKFTVEDLKAASKPDAPVKIARERKAQTEKNIKNFSAELTKKGKELEMALTDKTAELKEKSERLKVELDNLNKVINGVIFDGTEESVNEIKTIADKIKFTKDRISYNDKEIKRVQATLEDLAWTMKENEGS